SAPGADHGARPRIGRDNASPCFRDAAGLSCAGRVGTVSPPWRRLSDYCSRVDKATAGGDISRFYTVSTGRPRVAPKCFRGVSDTLGEEIVAPALMGNYARYDLAFERGEGAYL